MTDSDTLNTTPIQDFSDCHAGILTKLDHLAALPGLVEAAKKARETAQEALALFQDAVFEHHAEEERQLFPAVQAAATPGEERQRLDVVAQLLTLEHRDLEQRWKKLESAIKAVAKGQDAPLDVEALQQLVALYTAHARYEEAEYLPQAHAILSRSTSNMEALALALHLRHTPQVVAYV
jgi:hemerythrin-like domain-containing protein